MNKINWGATADEWMLFDFVLELTSDLLPVVSNPHAEISPNSKMQRLGKTPSFYNRNRQVVGFPDWTSHHATAQDIERWSAEPDNGICLRARDARAADIDITDQPTADRVVARIDDIVGFKLPRRFRSNSSKTLLSFRISDYAGVLLKRVIRCEHGIIEFLGDRQQFIVAGHHESGVRYEWAELGNGIPEISLETFERMFATLQAEFGIEKPRIGKERKAPILIDSEEPVLAALSEKGMVLSSEPDGRVHIVCPFEHEHTTESVESATTYWPAHTGGYANPAIKCLHAHCEARTFDEYSEALGISPADDFEDISDTPLRHKDVLDVYKAPEPERFAIVNSVAYSEIPTNDNHYCQGVLPRDSIGVLWGASAAGKSFVTFDLMASIARGLEWNGCPTNRTRVLYVCAEGQIGFRNRIRAYLIARGIDALDIDVMAGGPDLLTKGDIRAFLEMIQSTGYRYGVIVIDTYANCMSGDENSGKDVGVAVMSCKLINRVLGSTVLLIHHSPKAGGGARGHSALKAACDFELGVERDGDLRMIRVTKMKDGFDELSFGFQLKEVEIRQRDNGSPVTSCVVEYVDAVILKTENKRGSTPSLGTNETVVHSLIQDLFETDQLWPDRDYVVQEVKRVYNLKVSNIKRAIDNLVDKQRVIDNDGILSINC